MVAAFPGQVLVADHPGGTLGGCNVADLTGAGLARHPVVIGQDAAAIGGATAIVADRVHALAQAAQVGLVHRQRLARARGLLDPVDGFHQPRRHLAPGGDPGGHHRQLQRRGQHEALTDRGVGGIADQPVLAMHARLPVAVGGQPARHGGHRDIVADAQAELLGHGRDPVDPDLERHVVVIDVAALLQRLFQVHMAVAAAFPAMETAVTDLEEAGAIDRLLGVGDPCLERRHRGDHLEGRAGRIGALDRLVGQRAIGVLGQAPVVGHRDATHEQVGIETGGRGDGAQVAGFAVDDHGSRAFLSQSCLHIGLQRRVHGQLQIGAGLALAPVQLAHDAAIGVDFDPFGAGLAAQQILLLGLQPDLADLKARDAQHRFRVLYLAQVIVADRADIAHHMGKIAGLRIDPGQADLGRDAGQGGGVHRHFRDMFPTDLVGQGNRQEGRRAAHLGQGAVQFLGIERDQTLQIGNHRIHIARVLAHHDDPIRRGVLGDDGTVAVKQLAPGRRDQADVDPVFLGQQAKLIGLIDLHIAHAHRQPADEGRLYPAQQQGAAGQNPLYLVHVTGRPSHLSALPESRHPQVSDGARRTPPGWPRLPEDR